MIANIPRTAIKYKKWQASLKLIERGHKMTEWGQMGAHWYAICKNCQKSVTVDKGGHERARGKALNRYCST